METVQTLPPGATIGILGGGQLGMQLALEAYKLGYHVLLWCQSEDEPAVKVTARHIIAPFDSNEALSKFLEEVDVSTYEFEHLPLGLALEIEQHAPLYPSAHVLGIAQDRWEEKCTLGKAGIRTAHTILIESDKDLKPQDFPFPAILKTAKGGYDGRGQHPVHMRADLTGAWDALGRTRCVLEERVPFKYEFSTIIARTANGQYEIYDSIVNVHQKGILSTSRCPSSYEQSIEVEACRRTVHFAHSINLVGLLTIEWFATESLRGWHLIANEIAPRPHNSGWGTLDGCYTGQFEQHIRAICGLPLGSPKLRGRWVMENLIGTQIERVPHSFRNPRAKVYVYGKKEVRPGRKMGHVTILDE